MTEKLYYKNTYLKSFAAHVQKCEKKGAYFAVQLDRTAFYPEGGGQPSDTGVLNLVNVLDVQEQGEEIIHITDKPLPIGSLVLGGVNWTRRFHLMQQHTGEHIVSGVAHRFFGVDNVGFHMAETAMTVDWNGQLNEKQLMQIENTANEAVYKNVPVCIDYPTPEKLDKMNYRSKKELKGQVRIVTIPDCDVCACCGTHVAYTGEVGAIKIIGSQNYKGGTRISLVCGAQAMLDYSLKQCSVSEVSNLLSAKPDKISIAVNRMVHENADLKHEISELHNKILELKANLIPKKEGNIFVFEENLGPDDLRRFATILASRCSGMAAVFCGSDGNFRYAISSTALDLRPVCKELSSRFTGHGGGSMELVQGSLKGNNDELKKYFIE